MDGNITLIVKAANQSVPDHRLECGADWTVLKVKDLLSTAHPSKPKVEEQRLIYSGQLLLDGHQLRNVLRHPMAEDNAYAIHLVCSPPRHSSPSQSAATSSSSSSSSSASTTSRQTQQTAQPSAPPNGNMTVAQQEANTAPSVPNTNPSDATDTTEGVRRRRTAATTSNDGMSAPTPQGIEAAAAGYPRQAQVTMSVLQASADPMQQMATMQQMYANYMAYMQYIQMGGGIPWTQQMLHHIPTTTPADPPSSSPAAQAASVSVAAATDQAEQPAPQQQLAGDQNAAVNQQQQQQQQAPQQQPQIRMNAQGGEVEDEDENEGLGRDWLDWIYVLSRMVVLLSIVYFYSTISRFMIVVCIALLLYLYQAGWFRPTRRAPPEQQQQAAPEDNEMDDGGADDRNNNVNNNNNNNDVPDHVPMENRQDERQNDGVADAVITNRGAGEDEDAAADGLHVRPSLLALSWTFLTTFFTSLIPEQPQVI